MVPSPSFPVLDPQAVHVWFCELSRHVECQTAFVAELSDEERARAARFAFERDRQRFILSHGLLRRVLSRYMPITAQAIQFGTGEHGKPTLSGPAGPSDDLRFSLSHSAEYALIAVARGREVGVDVEVRKANLDCLKLAERFFAPAEAQAMATLHGDAQQRLFYRLWTAKEAYLKGRGVGLSFGLERFEIMFEGESSAARVRLRGSGTVDQTWKIRSLPLPDHLAGAVAVAGGDGDVHRYDAAAFFLA